MIKYYLGTLYRVIYKENYTENLKYFRIESIR